MVPRLRPVVIHRAILGSLDRFVAFLLEETKGNFPIWRAPKQAVGIPNKAEAHGEYADKVADHACGKRHQSQR